MDRLATTQEREIIEKRLDFLFRGRIKTMDRLAIIQEQQIVETAVTFSI